MPLPFPPQHKEPNHILALAQAILLLARSIETSNIVNKQELDLLKSLDQLATKDDLTNLGNKIMSAITDFAAQQKAFNDAQAADIDALVTATAGLSGDIQSLNDQIVALQNSATGLSDEDKQALADVLASSQALKDKTDAAVAAIQALDDQTPPVAPTA